MSININLIVGNVIEIIGEIKINIDGSVKTIMYVKKIVFGIRLHIVMEMENI